MRTNLFKLKNKKKNKIVLEEEDKKGPFLLFFAKYSKYIILLLMLLSIITLVIGIYFTVKNLNETTKIETNISSVLVEFEETSEFNSINLKPITGGLANNLFYKRYGNIGLTEGVILVVKEINSKNGLVTFYSDGSAKLVGNDGKIIRISSSEDGNYGVNENGVIIIGANRKEIKIVETKELSDGSKIIYYSDNSCSIIFEDGIEKILVRNSDKINIENNRLKEITPSGISKKSNEEVISNININYYENGIIKIEKDNQVYIIRNKEDIKIEKDNVSFPNNNEATILREITLKDGNKITYYTDGSAEIQKNKESIMIRKSKDIIFNDYEVLEIIETKFANKASEKKISNKEIIYLDNGGALIKNINGKYEYIHENSNIKFDDNGNIKNTETIKEITNKVTPDKTIVIDLEDGNSIIITEEGYRVIETDKVVYDEDGNIAKILGDEDYTIEIDESVSDNRFVITNISGNKIKYMVTMEVTDNYQKYAPKWLNPKFLRYNIVENANYLENQMFDKKLEIGTELEGNTIIQNETYILYEQTLENKEKANINLGIWLDYEKVTNDYQNSVFVGTIKIYTETIKLEEN